MSSEVKQLKSKIVELEDLEKQLVSKNKKLKIQFDANVKLIRELNQFLQILLNVSPFGVYIIQNGKFIFINKAFLETGNWSQKKVKDSHPLDFVLEEDREHVRKSSKAILSGETKSFYMFRIVTSNESIKWLMGSLAEIHISGIPAIVGTFVDLTEEKVLQLAYNDTLTGLPNRKLMFDRLEQAIISAKRRKKKLAVLFLDLDSFKDVNDTFGHKVGDKLLIEIAKELKEVTQRGNDTVARIGGDEFLMLLTDIADKNNIEMIIGKVFEKFSKALQLESLNLEIKVNVSIGVAIFPDHGKDSDTLINNADAAMYVVKKNRGKNNFRFFGT